MGNAKGNRFDKAAVVYKMIMEADDSSEAFAYFLDTADYINSSEQNEVKAYFTASQIQELEKEYGSLVEGILNKLVLKHLDKTVFYRELWKSVIESDLFFEKEKHKIFALFRIWSDGKIPYFQISDGMKMSDEEFSKIIKEKEELLHEIVFVMNCKFEQKTELSSILLNILERCKDEKERAVVLAHIINCSEIRLFKMKGIKLE